MRDKKDIVENWLPRYTGTPLSEFGDYVLLTNFDNYVEWFATGNGVLVNGIDRPMPNATADGHHADQFRHGKPECRHRDGSAQRHHAEGRACFSANAAA